MSDPNFDYVFVFDPKKVKVIPKIVGQWKELKNGTVKVWFTRAEWEDVQSLVTGILNGETNEYTEAQHEMVYQLPDF